jgi:hypothetical protein
MDACGQLIAPRGRKARAGSDHPLGLASLFDNVPPRLWLRGNTRTSLTPLSLPSSHDGLQQGILTMLAFIFYCLFFAGWITHLVVAISAKAWLFMIVGALIVPVAIVHGWSVWLGFDWLH